jgi:lipoprotein-anchoring transpeptidase ErfK/SrfK
MFRQQDHSTPQLNPGQGAEITRRSFLKLSGVGLAALFLPAFKPSPGQEPISQGRVISNGIRLYDVPSFNGKPQKTYWQDTVVTILEVTIGDDEPAYNRVWYKIGEGSYLHSGMIQPVKTQLNPVSEEVPESGRLAEVTVPFTDAHWGPEKKFPVAYRFYYATTHWVVDITHDPSGNPWYRLEDDKWKFHYYAPAEHLRLVPAKELTPISLHVPSSAKRLEIQTAIQAVIAYEWDRPVFMTRAATGAKFSNGDFSTPKGIHVTAFKRPYRHMAAGNLAANGYDLPGVPWVSYFTESGISFHGTYWHNNYGHPRSHGCVNLTPEAAKWIYLWTIPVVPPAEQEAYEDTGTLVEVI